MFCLLFFCFFKLILVWWFKNSQEGTYVAGLSRQGPAQSLEFSEPTLKQCVAIWGLEPKLLTNVTQPETLVENRKKIMIGGRLVQIPILPQNYVNFIIKRNRQFREINNMAKMEPHPHIIKLERVLEQIEDTYCRLFLVMELATSGTLLDEINDEINEVNSDNSRDPQEIRESVGKLLAYFFDLLQGVSHCHKHGVCHRDLKLENILLQHPNPCHPGDPIVKICDFGMSNRFDGDVGNDADWAGPLAPGHQNTSNSSNSNIKPIDMTASIGSDTSNNSNIIHNYSINTIH